MVFLIDEWALQIKAQNVIHAVTRCSTAQVWRLSRFLARIFCRSVGGWKNNNGNLKSLGWVVINTRTGHFGYIKLELPVFHIGYFKNVVSILQCVCKSCSTILLNEEDKRTYLRKFRHPRIEAQQKKLLVKAVSVKCKRTRWVLLQRERESMCVYTRWLNLKLLGYPKP